MVWGEGKGGECQYSKRDNFTTPCCHCNVLFPHSGYMSVPGEQCGEVRLS